MSNPIEVDREFRTRGLHPYLLFAAPFGICLIVISGLGVEACQRAIGYLVVVVFAFSFGAMVLHSCALHIWERLRIRRTDGRIVVSRILGAWSRSREFYVADIRSVDRDTSTPGDIVWPSQAGRYVRVLVARLDRPIAIGEGLNLEDRELDEIEEILRDSK